MNQNAQSTREILTTYTVGGHAIDVTYEALPFAAPLEGELVRVRCTVTIKSDGNKRIALDLQFGEREHFFGEALNPHWGSEHHFQDGSVSRQRSFETSDVSYSNAYKLAHATVEEEIADLNRMLVVHAKWKASAVQNSPFHG
jgi:hypothetical protein